jgi:anti-sigma factor RsiW
MARVVSLDSEEHRLAQELLPWLVNGTLDADELAEVAAHLEQCGRCQADAAAQEALRAIAVEPENSGALERNWAALRARLETEHGRPRRAPGSIPWWRLGLQLAVGLQAAVILVLAVVLAGVSLPSGEPYRALGANASAASANALIVFRADTSEREMRDILRGAGARIVGGPTVSDAYLVHLADPRPQAIAALRANRAVVRAESLQAGPQR